jgi:hypothetical protein
MIGAIAHAFYGGVPDWILDRVEGVLSPYLWKITEEFCHRYGVKMATAE